MQNMIFTRRRNYERQKIKEKKLLKLKENAQERIYILIRKAIWNDV